MKTWRALRLAVTVSLVRVGLLAAQSGGRDLPVGLRSIAGLTLNQDSAVTIRAKLGDTRERRLGAGHDAYTSRCYVAGEPAHILLELLSSAGETRTAGEEMSAFRLRADAPGADREGCANLPAAADLSTPAGLRLGLPSSKIVELLGTPTRQGADSLLYYFEAKVFLRPGTPAYDAWNTPEYWETCFNAGPPFAHVGSSVLVVMRGGRAAEIRVERNDQSVC